MINMIEDKIEQHINHILEKDSLCYTDYITLTSELTRLKQKEKEIKWEADQKERNEALMEAMKNVICAPIHP